MEAEALATPMSRSRKGRQKQSFHILEPNGEGFAALTRRDVSDLAFIYPSSTSSESNRGTPRTLFSKTNLNFSFYIH